MGRKCLQLLAHPCCCLLCLPRQDRQCPDRSWPLRLGQQHLFATGREPPECSLPERLPGLGGGGEIRRLAPFSSSKV